MATEIQIANRAACSDALARAAKAAEGLAPIRAEIAKAAGELPHWQGDGRGDETVQGVRASLSGAAHLLDGIRATLAAEMDVLADLAKQSLQAAEPVPAPERPAETLASPQEAPLAEAEQAREAQVQGAAPESGPSPLNPQPSTAAQPGEEA